MSANYSTSEEARAEHIESMGDELGSIYHALWQEIAWLHRTWAEYVVLFGTRESRVDLLNNTIPSFAQIIQDALWNDVLLHIARLTDPVKSGKKGNLTIKLLEERIEHARTKATVTLLVAEALAASEFCRDLRNRHIAHRDLELTLDRQAEPLPDASRRNINEALKALSEVLNAVSEHFLNSEILFDMKTHCGGAMDLLSLITDGAKVKQEKEDRLMDGKYIPDDFKPQNI